MKLYITFGQTHAHSHNGITFDKNCVGEITCDNYSHGRDIAFKAFGPKFCTTYDQIPDMRFFPRGIYPVN